MILDFPVAIQRKTVAVSERGFGTILIFDTSEDIDFAYVTADNISEYQDNDRLYRLASRVFMQKPQPQQVAIVGVNTAEVGVTEALNEVFENNNDWFFITSTDNDVETVKAISEFAQVQNKVYAVTINEYEDAEALFGEVYDNTFVMYHDDVNSFAAEGLAVIMSYNIGGKTAKFKTIQGVKAANVSLTQVNELQANNIFTYFEKLGVLQTSEGTMMSGEYIDVVLGEYWIRFRMEETLQRLAIVNDKIPYTNTGIGMLVGAVEEVLSAAVRQGIVEGGQYRIQYVPREQISSNDVALRKYDHINWIAMLQGAIHSGLISGVLTYDIVNEEAE